MNRQLPYLGSDGQRSISPSRGEDGGSKIATILRQTQTIRHASAPGLLHIHHAMIVSTRWLR